MTKEVEEIIRNKAYYELTSDERASVGEYAQNEEEYNNMQWFLTGTTGAFGAAKIEASSGLKKGVMEHLTESKKKKGFWLNSVGVFMLPTNKKFYQKPAFQLGIAAVLIAGLVFTLNPGSPDKGLAYVDVENEEPVELNETILPAQPIDVDGVLEDLDSDDMDEKNLSNDQANEQGLLQTERELAEMEPPMEEMNELTMDLSPAPAPMVDATNDLSTNSSVTYAAPVIEEVTGMDAEEDVALDYYMDDEVSEVEEKSDMDKDAKVMLESLDQNENRRDNTNTTSLRSVAMKKKDAVKENKLFEAEPSEASGDGAVITTTGNNNASGYFESDELIKPKALHINKTKELNGLFFIEK
jgi:hypothetical protein